MPLDRKRGRIVHPAPPPSSPADPTEAEIDVCLRVLETVRLGAGGQDDEDNDDDGSAGAAGRAEVVAAAAALYKQGKKGRRLRRKQARVARDRARLEVTGRVAAATASAAAPTEPSVAPPVAVTEAGPGAYERRRICYVCKAPYRDIDRFYHLLCPACADVNRAARDRRGDLRGRRALVTGGRIKIGFELACMLLRDGAHVTIVTRFPRDAAARFGALPSLTQHGERLRIVGMDLRFLPDVIAFAQRWVDAGEPLDILVNNGAQTIRRPGAYYRALAEAELAGPHALSPAAAASLAAPAAGAVATAAGRAAASIAAGGAVNLAAFHASCLDGGAARGDGDAAVDFPLHRFTDEQQPLDLRASNSWTLSAAEVEPIEMVEAQLVGSMAPFLLMAGLRPAMERSPFADRFVVNVTAMEGKFDYDRKTPRHPHTNMAKASLNMLTRTAAADYARSRVHVTSVDTGWVTDEKPDPLLRKARAAGFYPPLDVVDGAARVYAPILDGLAGQPCAGLLLKDYRPTSW